MKLKVETPLESSVDITLDDGPSIDVAALRAKFEQLNLPTEGYVFRRKGTKSLKFENGAEFEMVHKDDVVDEKEFEAVLNEAKEAQEELGKEVDAMLSLEPAAGAGSGGASGAQDSLSIVCELCPDFKPIHTALSGLLASPSDEAVDTFMDLEYKFWGSRGARAACKELKDGDLFDAYCALATQVSATCKDNGAATTKVYWPAGTKNDDPVHARLWDRIVNKLARAATDDDFHTPDRMRRYCAALVNDMKVRTVRGKDLPEEYFKTKKRRGIAHADVQGTVEYMVKTSGDLDLLRRMVAQVSRIDSSDGLKPDKGEKYDKKNMYMKPYDRTKRFLFEVACNLSLRDFTIESSEHGFEVLGLIMRIGAFMPPDAADEFLDNAFFTVSMKVLREPMETLCNDTDGETEETANGIIDLYSKAFDLCGAANGLPMHENTIGSRLHMLYPIASPKVEAAFLQKLPSILSRIAEYPRTRGDYPQYPETWKGKDKDRKDQRKDYIKDHSGGRGVALDLIMQRLISMPPDIKTKQSDAMIEVVGALLKACIVGPADLRCVKIVMDGAYHLIDAINVGKVARKNLLLLKNKAVIIRLIKHLTSLYPNVPEEIPGFPEWRKQFLIEPMSNFLRSIGPVIAKHKPTLAEAVGPLLGYVIRLGADDTSAFMQVHMQGYVQTNPEVIAPYVQVIMEGLKQEGPSRALGALPLLQHLQFQYCGRTLSENVELFIDILDSNELATPMGAQYGMQVHQVLANVAQFNPKALDDHMEDLIEMALADAGDVMKLGSLYQLSMTLKSYSAYNPEPFEDKIEEFVPLLSNSTLMAYGIPTIFANVSRLSEEKAEWCMEKVGSAAQNTVETYLFAPLQSMIMIAKDKPDLLKPYAAFLEKLQTNPNVQQIAKQAIDFMNGTNVDDQIKELFKAQEELKERVEHVEEDMKEVKQDVSVLTAEMTEVRDTLEVHSSQIAQTQNDVAENKEAIANASVNVDISEIELKVAQSVREDLNKLSMRVDQQEDALESLDATVSEAKDEIAETKAEMKLNFDQLQNDLDKRLTEFQKQLDEASKNLPIPCNYTHEPASKGLKVAVLLHFKCNKQLPGICKFLDESGEEVTFTSKTTFVNKWLKVGVAALQVGVAVVTQNTGKALKGLYSMWKNANIDYDVGFEAFVNQPFLLSEEQDALIKQLRKAKYFDAFANVEQQWICVACAKENARVKRKEERRKDFELQVERLEQARAKEAKAKTAKEKAKEAAKKALTHDVVKDAVKNKLEEAILGDDEEGEDGEDGEEEEEEEDGGGDGGKDNLTAVAKDVAKEAKTLAKLKKEMEEDEEEEKAAHQVLGTVGIDSGDVDAQGEDSNSSDAVGKLVSSAKKGEDDDDSDGGLCADCCVIQ